MGYAAAPTTVTDDALMALACMCTWYGLGPPPTGHYSESPSLRRKMRGKEHVSRTRPPPAIGCGLQAGLRHDAQTTVGELTPHLMMKTRPSCAMVSWPLPLTSRPSPRASRAHGKFRTPGGTTPCAHTRTGRHRHQTVRGHLTRCERDGGTMRSRKMDEDASRNMRKPQTGLEVSTAGDKCAWHPLRSAMKWARDRASCRVDPSTLGARTPRMGGGAGAGV